VGKADTARGRYLLAVLIDEKGAEHGLARPAAEGIFLILEALEHRLEKRRDELGLEFLRRFPCPRVASGFGRGGGLCSGRRGGHMHIGGQGGEGFHYITSISAWRAPADLIACRMVIMSRGLTPSAFRPSTSSLSEMLPSMMPSCLPS